MSEWRLQPRVIVPDALSRMRDALTGSPLVARAGLGRSFESACGFAATFRGPGRVRLERRLPALAPFLQVALDPVSLRGLVPWPLRWSVRHGLPRPNAFYVNLLLLEDGAGVDAHVDGTLRGPSGIESARPVAVSVLYLSAPPQARGGVLRLWRAGRLVGRIRPQEGALVHFRGDLTHDVTPVALRGAARWRASLVCEQYCLPEQGLERLPELVLHSKAGFAAFLLEHQARQVG